MEKDIIEKFIKDTLELSKNGSDETIIEGNTVQILYAKKMKLDLHVNYPNGG